MCMAEQCARHKKPTRAQERCAGKPVAHEVAYVWIVAELVPTSGRDTGSADGLAVAGQTGAGCEPGDPAYAESHDDNESAVGQRDQ